MNLARKARPRIDGTLPDEPGDHPFRVHGAGRWMAHCHIAEHHESGMMFSFDVAPAGGD